MVGFTDHYGRVHGKRFDANYFMTDAAAHGTHGCDYLLTADMEMEPVPGYTYANWELGYGDVHLVPDLPTLRVPNWLDRTAMVLCDLHDPHDHTLVEVAPRSIAPQLDRAVESGYTAWEPRARVLHLSGLLSPGGRRDIQDLTPAGWYIEDYHLLQGAREESITTERFAANWPLPASLSRVQRVGAAGSAR